MKKDKKTQKETALDSWKKDLANKRKEAEKKLAKLKKEGYTSAFDYLLANGYEFVVN